VDPVTGKSSRTVIESKTAEERPRISIKGDDGKTAKLPKGRGWRATCSRWMPLFMVEEGDPVKAGDIIAKLPRATTKTKGYHRWSSAGCRIVRGQKAKRSGRAERNRRVCLHFQGHQEGQAAGHRSPGGCGRKKEYLIPRGKHINVYEGDYIRAGEPLIGGAANPQDILKIKGEVALAKYLVDEVQEVYRLQGVRINDKHIEVIVRQMMRRVKVVDIGDTDFILEEQVDKINPSKRPTRRSSPRAASRPLPNR
jgi:DNA-directed RNA polymerase subunit beta'